MEITIEVTEFLSEIKSYNGQNLKVAALTKYIGNQNVKDILALTYNSMVTFGCNSKSCIKHKIVGNELYGMDTLFEKLINRELSGHAALEAVNRFAKHCENEEIFFQILDRDLKIGLGTTLINKVSPNLIPKFDVALAARYDKMKGKNVPNFEKDEWVQQAKSDGTRCVTIVKNFKATTWARSGKEYTTLGKVIEVIESYARATNQPDFVIDGEMCIIDPKTKINDFNAVMKLIKKKDHTMENPTYTVFDFLTLDGFINRTESSTYSERLESLHSFVEESNSPMIEIIRIEGRVKSDEDLMARLDEVDKRGEEGLIIRKANAPYEGKRTNDLLKLKKFADAEYIVTGQEFDKIQYREIHVDGLVFVGKDGMTKDQIKRSTSVPQECVMLTRVNIEHKGNKVGVGSGFSQNQRVAVAIQNGYEFPSKYENVTPFDIIGKEITVAYFELSKNSKGEESLRFPTCKHVYLNGRDC
jgi:DNA ligase 1